MKLIFFLFFYINSICIIFATKSKAQSTEKIVRSLQNELKEKNDYIQLLEDFIKKNLFTHPPPDSSLLKISSKAPISFLELKEHMQNKEKSQAGPVLKAMLFGFPNPRTYSFNNQKSKSSNGDNTSGGSPTKDNYANMKICEPGCIVI